MRSSVQVSPSVYVGHCTFKWFLHWIQETMTQQTSNARSCLSGCCRMLLIIWAHTRGYILVPSSVPEPCCFLFAGPCFMTCSRWWSPRSSFGDGSFYPFIHAQCYLGAVTFHTTRDDDQSIIHILAKCSPMSYEKAKYHFHSGISAMLDEWSVFVD